MATEARKWRSGGRKSRERRAVVVCRLEAVCSSYADRCSRLRDGRRREGLEVMDLIGEEEFEEGEEREVTRLDLWARRGGGGSATRWGNIHRSQLAPNRMVPYVTSVISVPNPKINCPPG